MRELSHEYERRYAAEVAQRSAEVLTTLSRADDDLDADRAVALDDAYINSLPTSGKRR